MPSMIAKEISAAEASLFWESCQTASVFCKPVILESLFEHVIYFAAFKGEEMICVWPVPLRSSRISAPNDFAYYFGSIFSDISATQPCVQDLRQSVESIIRMLNTCGPK